MEHRERLAVLTVGLTLGALCAWWMTRPEPPSLTPPPGTTRADVPRPTPLPGESPSEPHDSRRLTRQAAPSGVEDTAARLTDDEQQRLAEVLALDAGTPRHQVLSASGLQGWVVEGAPSDRVERPLLAPGGAELVYRRGSGLFRWSADEVRSVDASNGAEHWTWSEAGALVFSRGGRLYTEHHKASIELLADTPGRLTEPAYDGLKPGFVQDGVRLVEYDGHLITVVDAPVTEPVHGVEWCWRRVQAAEGDIACTSGVQAETERHELRPTWTGSELAWLVEMGPDSYDLVTGRRTVAERVRLPSGPVAADDGWVVLASEAPGVLEFHHLADDRFIELETGRAEATDPSLAGGRVAFAAGPDLVVLDVSETLSAPQAGVDPKSRHAVAP